MRKILYILLSFIAVSVSAQIEQPRIKFDQVIKDSTGSGRIVISSLTDSNMIYSADFYINTVDSLLILFGDTVQAGSAVDAAQVRDIIFATIDAGLGVEIDTSSQLGILTIQSLSVEDSVYNGTGNLIAKGTPLYVVGIQGNYWSVEPAQANDSTKMPVVAIAGKDIAAGQQGLGLLKGHIKGVDTDLFEAGDEIWVGATGGYTNVRPKGEDVLVQKLGTVVKANSNGSGIINLGEVQYNLNPNNIFIGGADSLQTTANLPTVLSDSLNNYVTIAGTETITGAKTFTSDLNVDAKIALNAGDNNIVIGDGAGANLVSGQALGNILVGTNAGAVIDSGDYNVANGYQALYNNTTGYENTANGALTLYSNTTGNRNIANGYRALHFNETGINNIANGAYALYKNSTGINNVANGTFALYNNTIGEGNVANGYQPLFHLSSGSNNQAYGTNAGLYLSNGYTPLDTANGSLFLGANTTASANDNTNEIVIGTNAIGNGSNSVTIGASTNTKNILYGNVGIGTTSPSEKLDVVGNIEVDGKMFVNAGDDNIVIGDGAGASLVSGQGIRNVLIGTSAGAVIDSGEYNIAIGHQSLRFNTTGSYNIANGGLSLYANETGNGNIANGFYALHNNLSGSYNIANAYESLYSNTSGNYNIGSGFRALYSLNSGSDNQAYGYQAGRYLSDGSTALTTANGSLFLGSNTRASADSNSNEIVIGRDAIGNGSNSVTIGNDGTIGTATSKTILNGNIGIGTSNPEANLDIIAPITSAANYQFRIRDVGNNGFFSVTEGSSGSSVYLPNFRGFGDGIDDYGIIFTGGPNSAHDIGTAGRAAVTFEAAEYDSATNVINAVENTHLFNFTNYGVSKMFMQNNGYVGIGTTTPDEKLDVDGNINASGSLTLGTPLSVANGGTGSADKNFVDLSTTQNISGNKTFTSNETVITNTSAPALLKIDAPANYTSSFQMYLNGTSYGIFGIANNSDDFIVSSTNGDFCLRARNNEKILFSSDGGNSSTLTLYQNKVGIGTPTPESKLAVKESSGSSDLFSISDIAVPTSGAEYGVAMIKSASTDYLLNLTSYGSTGKGLRVYHTGGVASDYAFLVSSGAGDRLILDGVGNLGLGVTPSASSVKTFEINAVGNALSGFGSADIALMSNAYYDNAFKYAASNLAASYRLQDGIHKWNIANSGTAGDPITFTQAMTLDASGRLGIGETSPSAKLDVVGTTELNGGLTQSGGDANFNNTLYVDESANSVGIGTSTPTAGFNMEISGSRSRLALLNTSDNTSSNYSQVLFGNGINAGEYADMIRYNDTKQWSIYNDGGDIFFSTLYSGGFRYDLFIEESNGNVGIGTPSPGAKLEISGFSTGAGLKLNYGNSSGTIEAVNFIANGGANGVIGMQMVSAGVGDLWLGGSGGRTLTLYRDGNVGIGTTSPDYDLEVVGDINFTGNLYKNDTLFSISGGGLSSVSVDSVTIYGDGLNTDLYVDTTAVIATKADLSGYVDLTNTQTVGGAKTFTSDVEIDGKLDLNYGGSSVFIGENAGASDNGTTNYNVGIGYLASQSVSSGEYNTAIGNSALRHNSTGSGNVAIGSTAGAFLKVGGNNTKSTNSIFIGNASRPDSISQSNQIVIGYFAEGLGTNTAIIGNGDLTDIYNGADNANFSTVSDARDKTSIQSLKLGLNLIEKLNPVAFVWNRRDGKRKGIKDVGFIAQEFDAALYALPHSEYTDFVKITEDGNWKLNLSDIYPVVIKAIQEQQAIIESQATEIETLKTLITELSNRLTILENN